MQPQVTFDDYCHYGLVMFGIAFVLFAISYVFYYLTNHVVWRGAVTNFLVAYFFGMVSLDYDPRPRALNLHVSFAGDLADESFTILDYPLEGESADWWINMLLTQANGEVGKALEYRLGR